MLCVRFFRIPRLRLVEVFEEVGSGKNTTDRPLFTQALEAVCIKPALAEKHD